MPSPRRLLAPTLLAALAVLATAGPADAHGSLQKPLSRIEGCYLEGAEHPKSAACQAAVALGGTAALYDWMSLRIGEAAGRHRQLIPDGRLCSAGSEMYKGMDLPRADWPATRLTSGADYTFEFRATAPHKGTFQLYLTNAGYSPTRPLRWADLSPEPFLTVTDPQLSNGSYLLPGKIPAGRTGRQLIYVIWQRSDSPEAFYSCSDVVFEGSGTAAEAPPVTAAPAADHAGHDHGPTLPPPPPHTPSPKPSPTRTPGATPTPTASPTQPPSTPAPASPTPSQSPTTTPPPAPSTPPTTPGAGPAGDLTRTASTRPAGPGSLSLAIGAAVLLAAAAALLRRRLRPGHGSHR
ncbi:lytic polysaccharide monooxygenase [Kitasatospora sp. NPDC096147]|uniref:lytic polysaccharide monooxygenase auxiliary activity family 9 protein n=1 Tax=Kitasatospora sp. NPDC096147 TaxID=3364093 RepID=UPI003823783B